MKPFDKRSSIAQQLADATFKKKGKKISAKHIRETYLEHLINQGYLDSVSSQLDRRADIYFAVLDTTSDSKDQDKKIGDTPNMPFSVRSPIFPSQNYIRSKILALLGYADENVIVDRYYSNPEEVFHEINNPAAEAHCNDNNDNLVPKSPDPAVYSNGVENRPFFANGAEIYEPDEKKAYSVYQSNSLYSCYYCSGFQTDNGEDYERHVALTHPGRPGHPNKPELKKFGLNPHRRSWEV